MRSAGRRKRLLSASESGSSVVHPAMQTRSSAARAAHLPNRICTASPFLRIGPRHVTPKGTARTMYFASAPGRRELLGFPGLDCADVHVALDAPGAAAAGARADVGLLDATAVDVDLGEDAAVAVVTVRDESHFAVLHQRLQLLFRRAAAGLVHLGGVDVGKAHLLVVA